MARSSGTRLGTCHVCGAYGPLTFEHVPPRAAYNNAPVIQATFEAMFDAAPGAPIKGPVRQRGAGAFTLCAPCNNTTGHRYGPQFALWSQQGMQILVHSRGAPTLVYPFHTMPLKVLKQIATMFFAINNDQFQAVNPDLVRFVLNGTARFLDPRYRFFVYFAPMARFRQFGLSAQMSFGSGRDPIIASEISFPPFGYVMTIDSPPPDKRLCEISHFSAYGSQEFTDVNLKIPALPTIASFPGDYRTLKEIQATVAENESYRREHVAPGRAAPVSR